MFTEQEMDFFRVKDASVAADSLVFAFVDTADTDNFRPQENDSKLTVLAKDLATEIGFDDNDGPVPQTRQQDGEGNTVSSAGSFDLDVITDLLADAGIELLTVFSSGTSLKVDAGDAGRCRRRQQTQSRWSRRVFVLGSGDDIIFTPGGVETTIDGGMGDDIYVMNDDFDAVIELLNIDGVEVIQVPTTNNNDVVRILRLPDVLGKHVVQISVNDDVTQWHIDPATPLHKIQVFGFEGDDTLIVNTVGGLITATESIDFIGGEGTDTVSIIDGSVTPIEHDSEALSVGPSEAVGSHSLTEGNDTQVVNFEEIEPFTSNVVAATFNITSVPGLASVLQDDNHITYLPSQILVGGGRIEIDNFEPIEFLNKTNLVIDAGSGRRHDRHQQCDGADGAADHHHQRRRRQRHGKTGNPPAGHTVRFDDRQPAGRATTLSTANC